MSDLRQNGRLAAVAVILALGVVMARQLYFPDARWWNLVMAGLLLIALGMYLWNDYHA